MAFRPLKGHTREELAKAKAEKKTLFVIGYDARYTTGESMVYVGSTDDEGLITEIGKLIARRSGLLKGTEKPPATSLTVFSGCHASHGDGECNWDGCPRLRDGEPEKSGRSCPRIRDGDEEDL